MTKAKPLDRIALTRAKMEARERMKTEAHAVIPKGYTKENSPFLQMVNGMKIDEAHTCPICGGELVRYEGCYRCKQCGWSKC